MALAHSTIIVCVPGLGDEVQAMKAGLLEAGEILVLNKADREGFEQTWRHLELLLHLRGGGRAAGGLGSRACCPPWPRAARGPSAIVAALDEHRAILRPAANSRASAGGAAKQQFLALARARHSGGTAGGSRARSCWRRCARGASIPTGRRAAASRRCAAGRTPR